MAAQRRRDLLLPAKARRGLRCRLLPRGVGRLLCELDHVLEKGHACEVACDIRLLERLVLAAHRMLDFEGHAMEGELARGDRESELMNAGYERFQVSYSTVTATAVQGSGQI
eukprot:5744723-Prymnesium_polylepis.1